MARVVWDVALVHSLPLRVKKSFFWLYPGPPSEPAGLTVETSLDYTSRSVTLRWTPGDAGGSAVTSWTIQAATDFNPAWTFIMQSKKQSEYLVSRRLITEK